MDLGPTTAGRGAHLAVEVGHAAGLNEPSPSAAHQRPRARGRARAVVGRRLLVLGVAPLRHPVTNQREHSEVTGV